MPRHMRRKPNRYDIDMMIVKMVLEEVPWIDAATRHIQLSTEAHLRRKALISSPWDRKVELARYEEDIAYHDKLAKECMKQARALRWATRRLQVRRWFTRG